MTKPTEVYRQPQALAFLGDICENPDDDAPRLIFADWLEDHGDEGRAEFIRAQIERERLPTWSLRYRQLMAREKELTDEGKTIWLEALGDLRNVTHDHTFRRGFVEHVSTRPDQYMHYSEEWFRRTPLRSLKFYHVDTAGVGMEELAREPHLKRLLALSLSNSGLGEERLPAFIAALESERLEGLDLFMCRVGEDALAALRAARLPRLRVLNLGDNSTRIPGTLRHLFAGQLGFPLRELSLAHNWLRNEDLLALCDWPGLRDLESLSLAGNPLAGTSSRTARDRLIEALGGGALTSLGLSGCSLDADGFAPIGDALVEQLTSLDLADNGIGAAGVRSLSKRDRRMVLAELSLTHSQLGDEGATVLADWPGLANVKSLFVDSNDLNESAFEALFTSPHLGEPVELSFRHSNPGSSGLLYLAGSRRLGQLHALDLNLCRLGDRRVEPLLTSPHLPNLRELKLRDNPIRKAMKAKLKARFPHGSI